MSCLSSRRLAAAWIRRAHSTSPLLGASSRSLSSGGGAQVPDPRGSPVIPSFGLTPEATPTPAFVGVRPSYITKDLRVVAPMDHPEWPVFRLLEETGIPLDGAELPEASPELWERVYRFMIRLQEMDVVFYGSQRQGRISFYMTSTGEEACFIGSAAALDDKDTVLGQYRETGIIMWRGFSVQDVADQLFGNEQAKCRGRSMPMLFGSKDLHFHTMSAPLATQIPQASGVAFTLRNTGNCAICYFGEGAASEGDFHGALNFAATLECPVIFFIRNNGYAISTPTEEQYRGDGIISRAAGYGMHAIRVDGNDVAAVYAATKAARELCVQENKPVMIEALTYRVGHHSTSDDSTAYRSSEEINSWKSERCPVKRTRGFLESMDLWNDDMERQARREERIAVMKALETAEARPKPPLDTLFTDVYADMPGHLKEQYNELLAHLEKYPAPGGAKH